MSTDRSLRELMSLDERVALVTGGAGHIGRVIAGGLAELGANIAIVDMPASRGSDVAAKLSECWPVKSGMFDCDFEQSASVADLPRRVREKFGRIDILVNCAAFVGTSGLEGWAVPFEQQTWACKTTAAGAWLQRAGGERHGFSAADWKRG